MALKRAREDSQALFQQLVKSDARIKAIRGSFRTKASKRRLISQVVTARREGTTKKQRLSARLGGFGKIARQGALQTIRKSKKGFTARIGGKVKGKLFRFKTRDAASAAVNAHHDKFLRTRLGKRGSVRAKKMFR